MRFLDLINHKLTLLEQDVNQVDAAMPPQSQNAADQSANPAEVDEIGQQANEQIVQNTKLCADIINALVVFINGKFIDQIESTPGLYDQLKKLEQQTTVTNIDSVDAKLLQDILAAVNNIKSL